MTKCFINCLFLDILNVVFINMQTFRIGQNHIICLISGQNKFMLIILINLIQNKLTLLILLILSQNMPILNILLVFSQNKLSFIIFYLNRVILKILTS